MPPEFARNRRLADQSVSFVRTSGHEFRILDHVGRVRKVGRNYVTQCPSCAEGGQDRSGDNLAISIEDPRKYLCWAGCTRSEEHTSELQSRLHLVCRLLLEKKKKKKL